MKKTAAFVLLALMSNSNTSQATRIDKSHRISADSFSNVGEDNDASPLMKMSNGIKDPKAAGIQSMAQQQVSADLVSMSGTLKKIQDHQNKMDEILETADREMNLGKKELENIEQFEKTLDDAREENKEKLKKTRFVLAQQSKKPDLSEEEQAMRDEELQENKKKSEEADKAEKQKKMEIEKQKKDQEEYLAKLEAYKKTLMPDGLYRDPDGSRVFTDNLQKVGGINNYIQKQESNQNLAEPPSSSLGGDTDTKNQAEGEGEQAEIAQAKVDSAKFESEKKAKEEKEEAEKRLQERLSKRNQHDGLVHKADGTRWDAVTDQQVTGVNDFAQTKSKNHKKSQGSKFHEPYVKPWHLGEIGPNESVSQAMDRQQEIDEAVADMAKPKHSSRSQKHHKHHRKHHSTAQKTEAPTKPIDTGVGNGDSFEEEDKKNQELAAAKKAMDDAEKAEKQRIEEEKRKKEEDVLNIDGLIHKPDGTKVFKPDGQIVGGVNNYYQKQAEPPAEPAAKEDPNIESMKEGQEHKSDIDEAKDAFPKKAKKDAEDAAEQQKTNEEAWKNLPLNEHDGLQHWPDGQKYYTPDKQKVDGVNNYADVTHRRNQDNREVQHQQFDIETFQEKEAREKEVSDASKRVEKKKQEITINKKHEEHVGKQMADGLYHTTDGHRFFQNGKEVSGVNELVQKKSKRKSSHHKKKSSSHKHKKHAKKHHHQKVQSLTQEPAGKPMSGTGAEGMTPVESLHEIEEHKAELATVNKQIADKKEKQQQEEDYKKHMKADGYWHLDDGTRVNVTTGERVDGANSHAQMYSMVQQNSTGSNATSNISTSQQGSSSNTTSKNVNLNTKNQTSEKKDATTNSSNVQVPTSPAAVKHLTQAPKNSTKPAKTKEDGKSDSPKDTLTKAHEALENAKKARKASELELHNTVPKPEQIKSVVNKTMESQKKSMSAVEKSSEGHHVKKEKSSDDQKNETQSSDSQQQKENTEKSHHKKKSHDKKGKQHKKSKKHHKSQHKAKKHHNKD